jgi:hypothetical protein
LILGAFFASQKTGLSAPIPRPACGSPAGFPISKSTLWICDQSLARKKRQARQRLRLAGCVRSTIAPRLCRLKLHFAVKIDADFRFEIGIAGVSAAILLLENLWNS